MLLTTLILSQPVTTPEMQYSAEEFLARAANEFLLAL